MRIKPYGRHWAVYDAGGDLVCLAVYRKGAREVVRRLSTRTGNPAASRRCKRRGPARRAEAVQAQPGKGRGDGVSH
ncbi:hypothetical protein CCAX7_35210 [Capsulimonas corticalis]|uniref:Uncharacterized protein n=1 Tax=Capsulimonas corticalis TaxID=2219043 RepID=A0A402CY50_9BACT|nr:hypothetical protein [Capsulimonas corticalis]BDI31470.1 hypothetical protein CCAX7_35210 [Capsulimonas corticalis]